MSKKTAIFLISASLLGAGAAYRHQQGQPTQSVDASSQVKNRHTIQTEVKVLTGSAKAPLFEHPDIVKIFEANGLRVSVQKTKATADDIAHLQSASQIPDLIWPAGAAAATQFTSQVPALRTATAVPLLYTELAIATWKSVAVTLLNANLAFVDKEAKTEHLVLNLERFLAMNGKKWSDLPQDPAYKENPHAAHRSLYGTQTFTQPKSIFVATPSMASNTSLLYYGLLAASLNNQEQVKDAQTVATLAQPLKEMAKKQGFVEDTLAGPFEDYIHVGKSKTPMVLVYDNQFNTAQRNGLPADAILMRMSPTLVIKHSAIATSPKGKKIVELLQSPEVRDILTRKLGYELTPQVSPRQIVLDEPSVAVQAALREELLKND